MTLYPAKRQWMRYLCMLDQLLVIHPLLRGVGRPELLLGRRDYFFSKPAVLLSILAIKLLLFLFSYLFLLFPSSVWSTLVHECSQYGPQYPACGSVFTVWSTVSSLWQCVHSMVHSIQPVVECSQYGPQYPACSRVFLQYGPQYPAFGSVFTVWSTVSSCGRVFSVSILCQSDRQRVQRLRFEPRSRLVLLQYFISGVKGWYILVL